MDDVSLRQAYARGAAPNRRTLLRGMIYFARSLHASETSGSSEFRAPPVFEELTEIEKTALKQVCTAESEELDIAADPSLPPPLLVDLVDKLGAEIAVLREREEGAHLDYAGWLRLAVLSANAAIQSAIRGEFDLAYGDALIRPGLLIYRKPRAPGDNVLAARSWLGGRPRLGTIAWPRDDEGKPIHFAAQLDLSEIAAVWREIDLPVEGSLAFFIGRKGAVIYVPPDVTEVTEPPQDMPSFGYAGIAVPGINPTVPCWPVNFMPMPPTTGDHDARYDQQRTFIASQLSWPEYYLSAERVLGPNPRPQWWHSAIWMYRILDQVPVQDIHEKILPDFVEIHTHLKLWTQDKSPWQQMNDEEARSFIEIRSFLDLQQQLFSDHCRSDKLLASIKKPKSGKLLKVFVDPYKEAVFTDFEKTTLALLLCAPAEFYESLPEKARKLVNDEFLLPPGRSHQMLGVPTIINGDGQEMQCGYMLLQLADDDLMFWQFNSGVYQFWISPEDLRRRNWSGAKLTFDC